jgi:tetratricopeptide (TPR) repeat protein
MAMGLFDWLKGKGSQQSGLEPLTDEQYKALFYRLLQGVADGWDADRLRQILGDRFADPQFLVWLRGYGEGLLTGTNGDWARLLVRLGEVGCGEIGEMAGEFGLRVLEVIAAAALDKGGVLVDGLQDQDANSLAQVQETFSSSENDLLNKAEKWFEKANALSFEGHYQEALTFYDQALKIKLDSYGAWNNRGTALLNLGRYEEAISSYDKALKIKPDNPEAWHNQGAVLSNLGRYEEAISFYDQALKIKPDDHETWNNRGQALLNLGRYEEAIASYDNTLKFKPDLHEAWYSRGVALLNLGRNEEAISSYDQALKIKPDKHEAWNNRGGALEKLGRNEEAISSYDQALKIKPDKHEAWNNRGATLFNLGRNEEAIASYDRALTLTRGKKWQAWINRASTVAKLVKKRTFLILIHCVFWVKMEV